MSELRKCPRCGCVLPAAAVNLVCPRCALELALRSGVVEDGEEGIKAGSVIGSYRVLEKLGEGGFGEVWRVETGNVPPRRYALKVLKPGIENEVVIDRFEAERRLLFRLRHPYIAKIFEAGTTERGLPFFVMELVSGRPVTKHCDERRLNVSERLALFLQICEAVQYVHQNGIIHRDLRASNILVARQRAEGARAVPKLIDFGMAKIIGTGSEARGALPASPFRGSIDNASADPPANTGTDIYSLGALLFELLVGLPPFDPRLGPPGRQNSFWRVARIPPAPVPSRFFSKLPPQKQVSLARRRKTTPRSLCRQLEGSLDAIVGRCLKRDRKQRLQTVAALSLALHNGEVEVCR